MRQGWWLICKYSLNINGIIAPLGGFRRFPSGFRTPNQTTHVSSGTTPPAAIKSGSVRSDAYSTYMYPIYPNGYIFNQLAFGNF